MANVTGSIKVNTAGSQVPPALPGNVTSATVNQTFSCNFNNGTAADLVDLMYVATLSLAAAATTLDLTSLTDVYGGAVAFARVRSITIKQKSTTNGQIVTMSGGASNGWTNFMTGTLILKASSATNDSLFAITAPNTTGWVVDSTHKTLKFDPGADTISIDVEIQGASA